MGSEARPKTPESFVEPAKSWIQTRGFKVPSSRSKAVKESKATTFLPWTLNHRKPHQVSQSDSRTTSPAALIVRVDVPKLHVVSDAWQQTAPQPSKRSNAGSWRKTGEGSRLNCTL